MPAYSKVIDLGEIDALDAKFCHTAAVLAHLDAVVCIDSSIAYLVGAWGRPGYLALPLLGDPRWGIRHDGRATWYPSLCVRRVQPGDVDSLRGRAWMASQWAGLVEELAEELEYGFVKKTLARRGMVV